MIYACDHVRSCDDLFYHTLVLPELASNDHLISFWKSIISQEDVSLFICIVLTISSLVSKLAHANTFSAITSGDVSQFS